MASISAGLNLTYLESIRLMEDMYMPGPPNFQRLIMSLVEWMEEAVSDHPDGDCLAFQIDIFQGLKKRRSTLDSSCQILE